VPRKTLKERTGKHICIECLKETPADDYFRNDHLCNDCAEKKEPRGATADPSLRSG